MPNKCYNFAFLLLFLTLTLGCQSSSAPGGIECGGGAVFNCPSGMYCELGEGCGGIDQRGLCRPLPRDCPLEDKPVCGCDGKTHASACYANGQGVTVDYAGACIE